MAFRVLYRAGRAARGVSRTVTAAVALVLLAGVWACAPSAQPAPTTRPRPVVSEAAAPAPAPPPAPAPVVAPPPAPLPPPQPTPTATEAVRRELEGMVAGARTAASGGLVSSSAAAAGIRFSRSMEMSSTAYCLRGQMRTGVRTRDGMAAGDPSVLPLGSVVRVTHTDGRLIGVFVIMDTGGAIRGNKIDIYMESCREASDWGRRPVVVEVLDIGRV